MPYNGLGQESYQAGGPVLRSFRNNLKASHLRCVLLWLVFLGQLTLAFGIPLPTFRPTSNFAYPCQNRACGCISAEECWKGDCCCFTLEEKIAWAVTNGVEAPESARQMADARRDQAIAPKKSCCAASDKPSCCEDATKAPDCPHCAGKSCASCREHSTERPTTTVRWVIGLFAQKCRGQGPAGQMQLDPAVESVLLPLVWVLVEVPGASVPEDRFTVRAYPPPTPPPQSC